MGLSKIFWTSQELNFRLNYTMRAESPSIFLENIGIPFPIFSGDSPRRVFKLQPLKKPLVKFTNPGELSKNPSLVHLHYGVKDLPEISSLSLLLGRSRYKLSINLKPALATSFTSLQNSTKTFFSPKEANLQVIHYGLKLPLHPGFSPKICILSFTYV